MIAMPTWRGPDCGLPAAADQFFCASCALQGSPHPPLRPHYLAPDLGLEPDLADDEMPDLARWGDEGPLHERAA